MKKTLLSILLLAISFKVSAALPFETAKSATDANAQQYYLYETGNQVYVKVVGEDILANNFTGDKFVFVEAAGGQYYIYNSSAGAYLYYTSSTASSNVRHSAESVIRLTKDQRKANTWCIIADDQVDCYDIIPGSVQNPTANTEGWNFRGGKSYALNLYDRSDSNAHWQILGKLSTVMPCATKVFSLPGVPFMHKLTTYPENPVVRVEGLPAGLELLSRPKYKYIYGIAPEEGEYSYTAVLADGERVEMQLAVNAHLAQPTPFMGILTWNAFMNYIDQDVILKLADGLEKFGLREVGYDHMCIDDCWARP